MYYYVVMWCSTAR